MSVPKYTTPTITLTFEEEELDLTQADSVFVTFESGDVRFTKTGNHLTVAAKQIDIDLSQEETAKFGSVVDIQANWMVGEKRFASDIEHIRISGQLLKEVIT